MNGLLYETTNGGGQASSVGYGTVYNISTSGDEKVIYRFAAADGAFPQAGLIDVNAVLYGTTASGGGKHTCYRLGSHNCGTVFTITTAGVETVLHRFAGGTDGFDPVAPLANVNGTLYGTTYRGGGRRGNHDRLAHGTVFALTP